MGRAVSCLGRPVCSALIFYVQKSSSGTGHSGDQERSVEREREGDGERGGEGGGRKTEGWREQEEE